jgi:hypothetical protein
VGLLITTISSGLGLLMAIYGPPFPNYRGGTLQRGRLIVRERTGVLMDLRKHVLELESSLIAAEASVDPAAQDAATIRSTEALSAIAARAAKNRPYSSVAHDLHHRLIEWMQAERMNGVLLPVPSLINPDLL